MHRPSSTVKRMQGKAAGAWAFAAFRLRSLKPFFAVALMSCSSPSPAPETYVFEGPTMGTSYAVKLVPGIALDSAAQKALQQLIEIELERVDAKMSTYREDSELSHFNAYEGADPFAVSVETWTVMQAALEIGRLTAGAFDITIGPLVNAWGFGPGTEVRPRLPDHQIAELLARTGLDKLALDEATRTLRKLESSLFCDLSGIAKGYAVDAVATALKAAGWSRFLVDIGGEVHASGHNGEDQAWRLGIERPHFDLAREAHWIVPLADLALATSGDYRNYRELEGQRFSHIIDPRDGRPIRHSLASVSVVHESCMMADALATGLMVMGPEEGFELAVRESLAVYFLVREEDGSYRQKATPAFERLRGEI